MYYFSTLFINLINMKKKLFFWVGILPILFCISCRGNSEDLANLNSSQARVSTLTPNMESPLGLEFSIKDGIMQFTSFESLMQTANYLNSLSGERLSNWSRQYNFQSQRFIFDKITFEEEKLNNSFSELTENELKSIPISNQHSLYYKDMLIKNIIKETVDEDGAISYDYTVCDPIIASVLNAEGFVFIKNTLYYADGKFIKKWVNANVENKELLVKTNFADPQNGISILYDKTNLRTTESDFVAPILTSKTIKDGTKKFYGEVRFGIWQKVMLDYDYVGVISYQYYLRWLSQKKNFWGTYVYYNVTINYSADWTTWISGSLSGLGPNTVIYSAFSDSIYQPIGNTAYVGHSLWADGHYGTITSASLSMTIGSEQAYIRSLQFIYNHKIVFSGKYTIELTGNWLEYY